MITNECFRITLCREFISCSINGLRKVSDQFILYHRLASAICFGNILGGGERESDSDVPTSLQLQLTSTKKDLPPATVPCFHFSIQTEQGFKMEGS